MIVAAASARAEQLRIRLSLDRLTLLVIPTTFQLTQQAESSAAVLPLYCGGVQFVFPPCFFLPALFSPPQT